MSQVPSDVYARGLLPKKQGYPLFVPEPYDNLPPEYRRKGASIGDIGIIKPDGSFDFLFSICAAADDPINCNGVPDGFETVELLPAHVSLLNNMYPPGSDVASAAVRKESVDVEGTLEENELLNLPVGGSVGYRFTSASSEAAILTLPEGAARQNLSNISRFRRHAIKHALRWYEFVNRTLEREASNGSLYLVTGCDKSTTWGIASVSCASETSTTSLKFTATKIVAANAMYSYSWQTSCPATVRIGPGTCGHPGSPQNQCNFLRGFKISVREGPMAAIMRSVTVSHNVNSKSRNSPPGTKGNHFTFKDIKSTLAANNSRAKGCQQRATGLQNCADTEDEDEDVIVESDLGATEVYHPLNAINQYLLDTVRSCL